MQLYFKIFPVTDLSALDEFPWRASSAQLASSENATQQ